MALTKHFRRRFEALLAYSGYQKKKLRFRQFVPRRSRTWVKTFDSTPTGVGPQPTVASATWSSSKRNFRRPFRASSETTSKKVSPGSRGSPIGESMLTCRRHGSGQASQAIALLLNRATGIVIAPTSVAFNWAKEIAHFAPTLRPTLFFGAVHLVQDRTESACLVYSVQEGHCCFLALTFLGNVSTDLFEIGRGKQSSSDACHLMKRRFSLVDLA